MKLLPLTILKMYVILQEKHGLEKQMEQYKEDIEVCTMFISLVLG